MNCFDYLNMVCYRLFRLTLNHVEKVMRAVIYLRVSTDDQSLGIEAQRVACLQYCEKNGIAIVGEYTDEGFSGGLPPEKRDYLPTAINSLGKGDILLVAKRDRIARCNRAVMDIERLVETKKARIISTIDEGTWSVDQDDPMSFLVRSMTDTFSQLERLTIKKRTKAALAVKKSKGERVGHIPFGYRLAADEIHLEVDENEQNIIRLMGELQKSGMSIREIAENLNSRNIFNRGSTWKKSSAHRILKKAA